MTFRLYDWGREFNPETARPLHLEEAIDLIDYRAFDQGMYRKGPLWGDEASYVPCKVHECHCDGDCHCHEEGCDGHDCHCHEEEHVHSSEGQVAEPLVERPEFNVTKINLTDPLHIYTEKFESFIIYVCIDGAASIQVPSFDVEGKECMENYEFVKGETVLVPADMPDFFLVPRDRATVLLEAVTRPVDEIDDYIDLDTEAFLENEDYEGLEDGLLEEENGDADNGASPFGFFGGGRGPLS